MSLKKLNNLATCPGFAVAIVSPEGVLYKKGFGYSDVENQKPFTTQSLLYMGSVSKTLTGLALMKLIVEGRLKAETPINDILPFRIYNPYFPKEPITVAHLATHTATFNDPLEYEHTYLFQQKIQLTKKQTPKSYRKLIPLYNENEFIPIPDFIESMMHPLGKWYKKKNFLKQKPGTYYEYSNVGALVAGYIIEIITGKPYSEYTKEILLEPLKMYNSGWSYKEVDTSKFVKLYLENNQKVPPYELISYADGGLISSMDDMSIYFHQMIKGYMEGEHQIISGPSFKKMMDANFVSEERKAGFFWAINRPGLYGHAGGDPGIMTFMFFDPKSGYGRLFFTNKSDEGGNGYNQLAYSWMILEKYIEKQIQFDKNKLNEE